MARFARVPGAGRAVGQEGRGGYAPEGEAVVAQGAAYLLRGVVVRAAVEQVHPPAVHAGGRGLYAVLLPVELGPQYALNAPLRPGAAPVAAAQRRGGRAQHLHAHPGVAGGEVHYQLAPELDHVRVYRPAARPCARGREHRVALVALKVQPVARYRVADGVARAVAVGLIEHVHAAVQHYRARRAQPVALAVLTGLQPARGHEAPGLVLPGDAYAPGAAIALGRQRVVHEAAAVQAHYRRVLGEGPPAHRLGKPHRYPSRRIDYTSRAPGAQAQSGVGPHCDKNRFCRKFGQIAKVSLRRMPQRCYNKPNTEDCQKTRESSSGP